MSSGPTGNKVFAPAIFFIAFREALEASLVIGILSGMLERIVDVRNGDANGRKLVKKLRKYIFFGAATGLLIAFAIGAAFLAVFYTQTTDLYGRSEELWEGIFNIIAVCLITPMSLAILRADRSRAKWRKKLAKAFAGLAKERDDLATLAHGAHSTPAAAAAGHEQSATAINILEANANNDAIAPVDKAAERTSSHTPSSDDDDKRVHDAATHGTSTSDDVHAPQSRLGAFWSMVKRPFSGEARGATAIFVIPMVTTLREGLEGVVFIGGVSLGLPATSIPLPAIVGLFVGLLCGFIVFKAGSFSKVRIFLVFSTCFLLVIAAGMFSRSVYYLQFYTYVKLVGDAAAESGSGPGSYNALNYVWHLNCCNPEDKTNGGSGWAILNSLVGWNNTATVGTILAYIFYWLAVSAYLIYSNVAEKRRAAKQQAKKLEKAEARRHRQTTATETTAATSSDDKSADAPVQS